MHRKRCRPDTVPGTLIRFMAGSTLRLRPWQRRALDLYEAGETADFLAVATPGAGKTTFALTAARLTLPRLRGRLVIVAPTRHLKEQWADAAERFGLVLDTDWAPTDGVRPDVHGIVTTYQQVGSSPESFPSFADGGFVILDEIHHAGEERSWGDGVAQAFEGAARRLALSGTPFRSDTRSIPFVRYRDAEVVPDVEYGYGDALADGSVVRPVFFPRFGGSMEWMAPDGSHLAATFEDPLARTLANQRLRAALSLDGDWLPTVLGHANSELVKIREKHPEAGGLVIAMDQAHAWGIADHLRTRYRVNATVAVSEDPEASAKISRYAAGNAPWIVAVRMVSEGVDIPRLRVGVYATTTTTELFFRQAVGRIVRWSAGRGRQRAYLFMPDDVRLRHFGATISETRRHVLVKKSDAETDEFSEGEPEGLGALDDNGEQLSLFAVLSATAEGLPADLDIFADDEHDVDADVEEATGLDGDELLVIDLASLPPAGPVALTRRGRRERDRLRELNAEMARQLVAVTGKTHAAVNFELNRLSGVSKVAEATVDQLDRRARQGQQWLDRIEKRRRMKRFV
jgi:superfamily II DNA or RNA helicase